MLITRAGYQFNICNTNVSPIVRKTIPSKGDQLAVYSRSNYLFGLFNAFGNPAQKGPVDYVIHLGDYIYEYKNGNYGCGNSIGRIPFPERGTYTLHDYQKDLRLTERILILCSVINNFPGFLFGMTTVSLESL